MAIVFSILVLICAVSMFFMDRYHKLTFILISCICLDCFNFQFVSFGSMPNMLCLFFFLSEFKYIRSYLKAIRNTPIKTALLVVTIGMMVLLAVSPHAHNPVTALGLIINELICKYFVIAYVFIVAYNEKILKKWYHTISICLVILTFFAILNFITKTSIIADITGNAGSKMAAMDRSRIVGMFKYPFDYGMLGCVLSLFYYYGFKKRIISKKNLIINELMCIFAILICGCRTDLLVFLIMGAVFIIVNNKAIIAIIYLAGATLLFTGAYFTIPYVHDKVDMTLTAFDETQDTEGQSSLLGRALQYYTVWTYVQDHKVLGRGYRFFLDDLQFNKNGNGMHDLVPDARPMLGLEGVMMNLLLERGFLGVFCYLFFYISLICYAIRMRKKAKLEAACTVATLFGFICYGNMTGELSSAMITLFMSGIYLKLAKEKYGRVEHRKAISNHNPGLQAKLSPANA